jgi:hypothetical protein
MERYSAGEKNKITDLFYPMSPNIRKVNARLMVPMVRPLVLLL